MEKIIFATILVAGFCLIAVGLLTAPVRSKELACTNSGGIMSTSSCCLSSGDFPNTCLIGACGCQLENSHDVRVCECPEGECFDGNSCVQID